MEFKGAIKIGKISISVLVLIFIVFGRWLFISPHVGNDLHTENLDQIKRWMDLPYTWGNEGSIGLGEYSVSVMWSWPLRWVFGLAGNLGFQHSFLVLMLGLVPALIFGWIGMNRLSGPIAALIYLVNTYFLLLVDGGQLGLALAYGILPLCFYYYLNRFKFKYLICVSLMSIFDIRVIYLLAIVIFVNFTVEILSSSQDKFKLILVNTRYLVITGLTLLILHAYWIVPSLLARAPSLPLGYARSSQVSFLSFANWKHAALLQQPHWYRNVFGQIVPPNKLFLVFPILALLGFVLSSDKKKMGYWLAIAVIGIFLAKGDSEPGGQIYVWLFEKFPGFSMFRDPTKFYFLIALGYSLLIGELIKKYRIISLLLVVFLLYLTYPVYSGKMTGTFSEPRFKNEYRQLNSFLSGDNNFGRILWVPSKSSLGESWSQHPGLEGFRLASQRPFSSAVVGSYETMNWLRDASYSGQLLSIAGVKYVIYPPLDPLREEMKSDQVAYHQLFQSQLETAAWAKKTYQFSQLKAVETKNYQGLFWLPAKTWFVVGSDETLTTGIDLSQEALIFTEDNPETLAQISRLPTARIKLYRKNPIDAAAALLPESSLIFPARQLKNDPDATGWWKRDSLDFLWWRSFLQDKYKLDNQDFDYQGGWAIGEGNSKFEIRNLKFKEGNILLVRVMTSPRGGVIKFFQNGKQIGQVDTRIIKPEKKTIILAGKQHEYDRAEFAWNEIGRIETGEITMQTQGDINVMNVLAAVNESQWLELKNKANEMISKEEIKTKPATVSYQKVSPAHYQVKLDGNGPQILVFSQTFDPLWTANGQGSIEAYGFLNAFPVAGSGEYDIYFTPQKYVWMQWIWDKISKTK